MEELPLDLRLLSELSFYFSEQGKIYKCVLLNNI